MSLHICILAHRKVLRMKARPSSVMPPLCHHVCSKHTISGQFDPQPPLPPRCHPLCVEVQYFMYWMELLASGEERRLGKSRVKTQSRRPWVTAIEKVYYGHNRKGRYCSNLMVLVGLGYMSPSMCRMDSETRQELGNGYTMEKVITHY